MDNEFTFGLENEFMLLDRSSSPLSVNELDFFELRKIILGIPCKDDTAGFKAKEPNKCNKPYYVEGYDYFRSDGSILRTAPKGLEIRTPIRNGIDGMVEVYHELFDALEAAVLQHNYRLCLISHHPTGSSFHGPKESRTQEKWIHEQGAVFTYGPDINIGLPPGFDTEKLGSRIYHYAPAFVSFSLNAPVYKGKRWHGKSIRIFNRAMTGPVFKYHPSQNRWEFKNLDVPIADTDIINYSLMFLTILTDDDLTGNSDNTRCREELRDVAERGWTIEMAERASELLERTRYTSKKYGFQTDSLGQLEQRLRSKAVPADLTGELFDNSRTMQEYLFNLSKFTNLRTETIVA